MTYRLEISVDCRGFLAVSEFLSDLTSTMDWFLPFSAAREESFRTEFSLCLRQRPGGPPDGMP